MNPWHDDAATIRRGLLVGAAQLRYSARNAGLRDLLRHRGHDPMRSFLLCVEQGDDVAVTVVLEHGNAVLIEFREDHRARQAFRVTRWQALQDTDDPSVAAACGLALDPSPTFDEETYKHFAQVLANYDRPLPPISWGGRPWHAWENPPD